MNLVSTHFFSIMFNGSPMRLFYPSQRIRKGDPLSPFIFILMVEWLSNLLQDQSTIGEICGINLHEEMDKQTHQKFMDDMMLMGNPSI